MIARFIGWLRASAPLASGHDLHGFRLEIAARVGALESKADEHHGRIRKLEDDSARLVLLRAQGFKRLEEVERLGRQQLEALRRLDVVLSGLSEHMDRNDQSVADLQQRERALSAMVENVFTEMRGLRHDFREMANDLRGAVATQVNGLAELAKAVGGKTA